MTDLCRVTAEAVSANISVDDAEEKMIASGVRLLFVTNPLNHVIGIVDLSGERVLSLTNDSQTARKDLIVRDIMTPQHKIEVLEMGDIVTTLKRMGRQHALVVDHAADGRRSIRCLLSTVSSSENRSQPLRWPAVSPISRAQPDTQPRPGCCLRSRRPLKLLAPG